MEMTVPRAAGNGKHVQSGALCPQKPSPSLLNPAQQKSRSGQGLRRQPEGKDSLYLQDQEIIALYKANRHRFPAN